MITDAEIAEFVACRVAYLRNTEIQNSIYRLKGITPEQGLTTEIGWDAKRMQVIIPERDAVGKYLKYHYFDLDDQRDWFDEVDNTYKEVNLSSSISAKYHGEKIRFSGIVIGKDLSPYLIPYRFEVHCEDAKKKKCDACLLTHEPQEFQFHADQDKDVIVRCINTTDQQVNSEVRKWLRLPSYNQCRKIKIKVIQKIDVEEIRLTNEIDHERIDSDYVIHKCYLFANRIQTNQNYCFWGTTWVDPKSQQGIHIIRRIKSERDSITKWQLSEEMKERLRIFQVEDRRDYQEIALKIDAIHNDLAHNVTKIWKRNNILFAIDLVMHTVLNFNFLGEPVTKGWGECAIVGDTRTGKTETVKKIMKHYRSGEFITSGENTSLAGLLGGLQQMQNGRWTLNWGKIVINHRGLVGIDEADELAAMGVMGKLTGVRSSGVAELVKVQTQRTMAQTRMIFVANPKQGNLKKYAHGVETLWEIFGKAQDISRLDFATFADASSVDTTEINKRLDVSDQVKHLFTSELCHSRVMFAWTRDAKNIIWMPGTEDYILQAAIELGEKYTQDIPLIISAEMRIKLARMAISIAIQTYSTDDYGENVLVYIAHAMIAARWIDREYMDSVAGYYDFSEDKRRNDTLRNIMEIDTRMSDIEHIGQLLLSQQLANQDFEDIFGLDRDDARGMVSLLRRSGAIVKDKHFYIKTPQFIRHLKKRRSELQRGR